MYPWVGNMVILITGRAADLSLSSLSVHCKGANVLAAAGLIRNNDFNKN